jgi:hypothetical protein
VTRQSGDMQKKTKTEVLVSQKELFDKLERLPY